MERTKELERYETGRGDRGGGGQRVGNKLWARGVWRTCCAHNRDIHSSASADARGTRLKFCLNARQALPSLARFLPLPETRCGNSARSTNISIRNCIARFIFLVISSKHEVSIAL